MLCESYLKYEIWLSLTNVYPCPPSSSSNTNNFCTIWNSFIGSGLCRYFTECVICRGVGKVIDAQSAAMKYHNITFFKSHYTHRRNAKNSGRAWSTQASVAANAAAITKIPTPGVKLLSQINHMRSHHVSRDRWHHKLCEWALTQIRTLCVIISMLHRNLPVTLVVRRRY